MDLQLINRVNMIKNVDKFLDLMGELKATGNLGLILALCSEIQDKMQLFNISITFNLSLWIKLKNFKSYFNYLRIAKQKEIQIKWLNLIFKQIPEVLSIFEESNQVFDYYKESIIPYLNEILK